MAGQVIKFSGAKNAKLLGAVMLIILAAAPLVSAEYPDLVVLNSLDCIQQMLFNEQYEEARQTADSLIRLNPEDPLPLLAWASTLVAEMKEEEANLYPDLLVAILKKADSIATPFTNSPVAKVRAWGYLARGHVLAYRSLWEARFGSTASAYRRGKHAKAQYQLGLACDSSLYDLYAGMGEYNYWKSAKAGLLRSIGLIKNEKEIGLSQMKLAADSSKISKASARRGLMWVYLDIGEFDSTINIGRELAQIYPGGRTFLWAVAQATFRKKDYTSSVDALLLMRERMLENPGNYHKLISVDKLLVEAYRALDMPREAYQAAKKFLAYRLNISKKIRKEQKEKIRFLKKHARV